MKNDKDINAAVATTTTIELKDRRDNRNDNRNDYLENLTSIENFFLGLKSMNFFNSFDS